MLILLTNIAKYRRQANHIDETKFEDTEGLLAFGADRKYLGVQINQKHKCFSDHTIEANRHACEKS